MHLVAFHRVEIDKIDWKKPLINQVASYLMIMHEEYKYIYTWFLKRGSSCQCGVEFEFQEEVHQV